MDKTLAFIERLGRDARLGAAPATVLAAEARAAGVAPALADALARRDPVVARQLLAAVVLSLGMALPATGWCNIATPNDQPAEEVPPGEGETDQPEEATVQQPEGAPAQQQEPAAANRDTNEAPAAEEEEESAEESESFDDEDGFEEDTSDEEQERR